MAMLRTHYRQPIDWTTRGLQECERALQRFGEVSARAAKPADAVSPGVVEALSDDVNTPAAIAHLHQLAQDARSSQDAAAQLHPDLAFLGLDLGGLEVADAADDLDPNLRARIEGLVSERLAARRAKNWAESDRLRSKLTELGVALKDSKDGTTWEIAK
jgi:cysteinyl-tRNA synthetase